jgi:SAM-dependent methyltransferase
MVERLSTKDDTLLSSYAEHILRYRFAAPYCQGKHVLDAGCGVGYGSSFLAQNGAAEVTGIDISASAIEEANRLFKRSNLSFMQRDCEKIGNDFDQFDVVVNFENIEHVNDPNALVAGASKLLPSGTFITSSPNGAISSLDRDGRLANPFHVHEFTEDEFTELLSPHFNSVKFYGQWLTHQGKLRKIRALQAFELLNELYYNPANRIGRAIRRAFGKNQKPPQFFGGADSFDGDYIIQPIETTDFPWEPTVILAVCANC